MLHYKKLIQAILGIVIIMTALAFGIDRLDLDLLRATLTDISALYLVLSMLAIILAMALSTARFAFINKKFGGNEDWLFLHRVNMLSLLYSQIALPLITQIIGRISHGSSEQRVYYAPLTVLEKSIAFIIMLFFGGVAAFLLLNENIIPPGLFQALALMGAAIFLALTISLYAFFSADERRTFMAMIQKITQIGILRIIGLSVLLQLNILLIYTILALQFVPDANLTVLIGAFAIVVLATSIPIGFGGWGVREAAAAGVFLALGMPPEIGVLVGLLYGVLHLIILTVSVLVLRSFSLRRTPTMPPAKTTTGKSNAVGAANPFQSVDFWPLTFFLMMALLPFQIRVPMANSLITLNTMDLLALVVMINFTVIQRLNHQLKSIWQDRLTWLGIIGIVFMIVLGWVVGWLRFGSNEWATANRLMGLIPIISYLFAGAALRHYLSSAMRQKLALVFAFSIITSIAVKVVAYNVLGINADIYFNWKAHLQGFIADRNAFSFICAFSIIFLVLHIDWANPREKYRQIAAILITIIATNMFFVGSRSGADAAIVIALWLCWSMRKHLHIILMTSFFTVVVIMVINALAAKLGNTITFMDGRNIINLIEIETPRRMSLESGYTLFKAYPIFGGGLGAGIRETGLVIHNLFLWILGEMGLIGAALCIPMVLAFLRTMWHAITRPGLALSQHATLHGLVLFIVICGGFSLVQDISYQRILWLMIGFLMARPMIHKDTTEN